MIVAKKFLDYIEKDGFHELITDGPIIRLYFLTDEIIRIRSSFDENFEESSYTLALTAWEDRLDDFLGDYRRKVQPIEPRFTNKDEYLLFETSELKVQIIKNPFNIRVLNNEKELLHADLVGRGFVKDHLNRLFHYSAYDEEKDHFYGFGERTGKLDKKNTRMRLSPKDAIGHDPEFGGPLYKHIPFYIKINEETKNGLGYFYHNSYDTVFDMGNEISGYYEPYTYYSSEGGDIDWFIVGGKDLKSIVENYTLLTGRQIMPPKQSLGFTISTMYYAELEKDCDKEILTVIDKHRELGIHVDNFKISSGYTSGLGTQKRYVFNWNTDKFPDPDGFFDKMNDKGIALIPNIKPGILLTHPLMDEFLEEDVFVKTPDGKDNYESPWWGGLGRYFDFTNPAARNTWKKYLKKQLIEKGTICVWNDNCEYDGVEDREAYFDYDGKGGRATFLRALQGNLMAHIGIEAVQEVYPNKRPYIINRAGFAGIQKYAQTWAGDNLTDWKTPKFNVETILGMGLSGVANTGCDIGGFAGNAPEAELLLRWIQNGIFQPRFCINSANSDNKVTEAWMYDQNNDHVKAAYQLRYRMIEYIYTQLFIANKTGAPILRPLFYEFPDDIICYTDENFTFMFGEAVLVANVFDKGAEKRRVYLPKGCKWYRLDKDMECFEGGSWIEFDVDLTSIPMFLRENGLFFFNNELTSIVKDTTSQLDLYIAGGMKNQKIYEDDGVTNAYKDNAYLETNIDVSPGEKRVINFTYQGDYESKLKEYIIHSIHPSKSAYWVSVNGDSLPRFLQHEKWEEAEAGWTFYGDEKAVLVKLPYMGKDMEVIISYEKFDLIGMTDGPDWSLD